MHSLGVLLLEILVGTEVVLSCREREDLIELITECKEHIDKVTVKLLHRLILDHKDDMLTSYIEEVLVREPEIIARNIRKMNWAVEEVRVI